MRLIDADTFREELCKHFAGCGTHENDTKEDIEWNEDLAWFIERMDNQPTVEPENDWIPCAKRLPEDLEEVNVTWVNHDPEPYYNFVKDKPFTATAVYYKEKWYWYSSTCTDMLAEYGRNPNQEIDDGIEITAWAPLPKPYKPKEEAAFNGEPSFKEANK